MTKPVGEPIAGPLQVEPGGLKVTSTRQPAAVTAEISTGRTSYAGEKAGDAARSFLDPPNLHDPALEAAAGPIGFVLAPFAAAYGAISAGSDRMPAERLNRAEADVVAAMKAMAEQGHLRDDVREALVGQAAAGGPATTVLETKVERLRLEPAGPKETSFALTIDTRVRLLRSADGAVLYDQPFRYQSGTALFTDWACRGSIENVAQTGYRALARSIAESVKSARGESAVLVGAGFKQPALRPQVYPVAYAPGPMPSATSQFLQVADVPVPFQATPGIYSSPWSMSVTLQKPLTREEAVPQAVEDVEWSLDGMQASRNSVVQATVIALAVPYCLVKQVVAAAQGTSAEKVKTATARLSAVASKSDLQRQLAREVADRLAARPPAPARFASLSSLPTANAEETAVGIRIENAALTGKSGINPPLALCVEARTVVFRVRDGAEVCSWPVHYRGSARKFTQWAADDARLFRQELTRCRQQIGAAIIDQLEGRQIIGPSREPQPLLAKQ